MCKYETFRKARAVTINFVRREWNMRGKMRKIMLFSATWQLKNRFLYTFFSSLREWKYFILRWTSSFLFHNEMCRAWVTQLHINYLLLFPPRHFLKTGVDTFYFFGQFWTVNKIIKAAYNKFCNILSYFFGRKIYFPISVHTLHLLLFFNCWKKSVISYLQFFSLIWRQATVTDVQQCNFRLPSKTIKIFICTSFCKTIVANEIIIKWK